MLSARRSPHVGCGSKTTEGSVCSWNKAAQANAVVPIVLTVAGSDPSGGAGLQADLKTIHAFGGYGAAVPTLLTVQSTRGVSRVEVLEGELVQAQLDHLLEDMAPAAAKTGALGSADIVRRIGERARTTRFPWVVDPVFAPTRGASLSTDRRDDGTVDAWADAMRGALLPWVALVTPNVPEAEALTGLRVRSLRQAADAAERILDFGPDAVLLKGGHLPGDDRGVDLLLDAAGLVELRPRAVVDGNFHGTGCALSAAIATRLAFGDELSTAVRAAKGWLERALTGAMPVGGGALPVNHLVDVEREA